ncbi:MAG: SET domain-containing protein-lysine N-methyltransferase [Leptospiraceae bacterium]|nr:SET domain-containing protein-lysine N-methyltransferase [Leptospiraceae bacterium]
MNEIQLEVVNDANFGYRLVTRKPIPKNTIFFDFKDHKTVGEPNYKTIQVNQSEHVEDFGVLAFMNHNCEPNVIIDSKNYHCIASKDIEADEELTFFYPSTEWAMAQEFQCKCSSEKCIGLVSGASTLPINVLSRYYINQHIIEMINESLKKSH